jgi:putative ABC transport system permease protein
MNVFSRGIRNAFRNSVRTLSIVIILGLSIGLSLTMLIAHQAVNTKINQVKASVGNTITIAPAGYSGFSQVNNSLTSSELSKVSAIAHVSSVNETLTDRLYTTGTSQPNFGGFGGGGGQSTTSATKTTSTISLKSPITINTSGGGGGHFFENGGSGSTSTADFSLPITILGASDPTDVEGTTATITSGSTISGTATSDSALVSQSMATKNSLKVGSTFTAYSKTITVAGIFKSGTQAAANDVVLSLPTVQSLSGQSGDVTSATVTVDSLDNLSSVTDKVKSDLGSAADVTSSQDTANETVAPLNNVKNISFYSLIGAVVAGSVIILMTMIMIVRERKREIGVIKAIGGSNLRIMFQFMAEALTLTVLGAIIGLIIGFAAGGPVTNTLVTNSSNSTSTTTSTTTPGRFGGGGGFREGGNGPTAIGGTGGGGGFRRAFTSHGATAQDIKNIHAEIGWSILIYGFGAAILIAIIGSAIAAGLIAKVRPSEVMRAD